MNGSGPVVSVVIPTYNHAHMLKEALRSVVAQTISDWEAIVINNYSTDNTEEVVESFNDPRIKLISFRNNGVIAASRNVGIRLAKAQWVAFLDSDDVWYPAKLEKCLAKLIAGAELVCHGELWRKDGAPFREVYYGPAKQAEYCELLLEGNCLSTSAVVVEKSALDAVGGFSEEPSIVTAEDYDLWLKLAARGGKFVFIEEVLGEYRLHGTNESRGMLRNLRAVFAVVDKHCSKSGATLLGATSRIKQRRARLFAKMAMALFRERKISSALRYAVNSIWQAPLLPFKEFKRILK